MVTNIFSFFTISRTSIKEIFDNISGILLCAANALNLDKPKVLLFGKIVNLVMILLNEGAFVTIH